MVGAAGLEPTTSCTQNRRATRLRHAPTVESAGPYGRRGFDARINSGLLPGTAVARGGITREREVTSPASRDTSCLIATGRHPGGMS